MSNFERDPSLYRLALSIDITSNQSRLFVTRKDGRTDGRIELASLVVRASPTDLKTRKSIGYYDVTFSDSIPYYALFKGGALATLSIASLEPSKLRSGTFTMYLAGPAPAEGAPAPEFSVLTLTLKNAVPFTSNNDFR